MTALRRDADPVEAPVDVSVIIVTYNSRSFIDECLRSVDAGVGSRSAEIIVVDNASLDGTADHIEDRWPDVQLIRPGWNSGFSRGCNLAAAQARGRWLFFLNGDAVAEPGSIEQLIAATEIDPAGVFAPRVLHPDGTDQGTARSFPSPAAFAFGRRSPLTRLFPSNRFSTSYLSGSNPSTTEPYEVDWVSGAALLLSRTQFQALDGFDEGFFMYWEDADLCHRAKDRGASVWCVPSGQVVHAEGSSAATTSRHQNKRFHDSAYRYACKHILRGPAAVLRPGARAALVARRLAVVAMNSKSKSKEAAAETSHLGARS